MIHILLTILKIIGILLAVLLAAVLVLLLAVLFIPIRYQGKGSREAEKLKGQLSVSWMLHLVHFRIRYPGQEENKAELELFLFGLPLVRLKRFFTRKRPETEEKSAEKIEKKAEGKPEAEKKLKAGEASAGDFKPDSAAKTAENPAESFLQKIKGKIKALCSLPGIIGRTIRKIYLTLRGICDKIKRWNQFFHLKEFSAAKALVLRLVKRLLKHIAPVRIEGNLQFGFEDPSVTGNVLAAIALFYPVLPRKLVIIPDFQNKRLEGNLKFRGRIYGIVPVIICLRIWFDKNIRALRKKIKEV